MSNSSSITPVSLQTNEPGETSVVQQDESTTGPSHVQTMYLPSETGETGRDWHRGSHVRYTELLRKHQRQPQGTASLTHRITYLCMVKLKEFGSHAEWYKYNHSMPSPNVSVYSKSLFCLHASVYDEGPTELYQHPLTTSSEYGWWLKDGSPHREQWAQSERHVYVNSEMTR